MAPRHLAARTLGSLAIGIAAMAGCALGSAPSMTLTASSLGSSSSIRLMTANPALGSTVFFSITYPSGTRASTLMETVECYQNGAGVWAENLTPTQASQSGFKLGGTSSYWLNTSPGPANCATRLYSQYRKGAQLITQMLATTTFNAAG